jgi:hypothetical protein
MSLLGGVQFEADRECRFSLRNSMSTVLSCDDVSPANTFKSGIFGPIWFTVCKLIYKFDAGEL